MALDDDRTYYEVLGVSPTATATQLRDAHRQMALVLHPDRHVERSAAEQRLADRRMKEVNVAWSVLSDPAKRSEYDRSQRARNVGQGRSGGTGNVRTQSGAGVSGDGFDSDFEGDDFDWDSLSDRVPRTAHHGGFDDGWSDEDDEVVPQWQYWMFKRGPLIAILVVAAIMFIATAYAGSGGNKGSASDGAPETSAPKRECVSVTSTGRSAVRVPCSSENDGRIVTRVNAALDCPRLTTYVVMHDEFYCVSNDPAVVGTDAGG